MRCKYDRMSHPGNSGLPHNDDKLEKYTGEASHEITAQEKRAMRSRRYPYKAPTWRGSDQPSRIPVPK
jgi:hypothetical protein